MRIERFEHSLDGRLGQGLVLQFNDKILADDVESGLIMTGDLLSRRLALLLRSGKRSE